MGGPLGLGPGSLAPASAGLQPGHELLGRLVLQVGAHVAGVGAVCVPSKHTDKSRAHTRLQCLKTKDQVLWLLKRQSSRLI